MVDLEKEVKKDEKKIANFFKNKTNVWMTVSIVLAIGLVLALAGNRGGSGIGTSEAGESLVTFLNTNVVPDGGVTLKEVIDKGSLYQVNVLYNGQDIPVFISKDGKYFIQGATDMTAAADNPANTNTNTNTPASTEVPKSDKPVVELFVMSYCPYGTQAEKGFIPMAEALGSKVDAKIRFVHYILHGEKETQENYRQICIREEQGDKFWKYLKCTLNSTDPNAPADVTQCMTKNGIVVSKVNDCLANRAEALYKVDADLSQQYGVQGSPTLIINGVESNAGRNSASYLTGACGAFNTVPSECSKTLPTANPSPGFGFGSDSSSVAAACRV